MFAICPCGGASMTPLYTELGWIFVAAVAVMAAGLLIATVLTLRLNKETKHAR